MKRTKSSGLKVGLLLLIVLSIFSVLTLSACRDKFEVTALEIVSAPDIAKIGEFNINSVQLRATIVKNGKESQQEMAAESAMLTTEGLTALKTEGPQQITLYYRGQTATFNILVVGADATYYTVTFKTEDGSETLGVRSAITGSAIPNPPVAPPVTGKTFIGWKESGGSTVHADISSINASMEVTAAYAENANMYTVRFIDHNGNVVDTRQVRHGVSVTPPSVSLSSNEQLNGENPWGVVFPYAVTQDIDFYLSVKKMSYSVQYAFCFESARDTGVTSPIYDEDSGSSNTKLSEEVVSGGDAQKTEKAKKWLVGKGYEFLSWKTSITNITSNTTLVAVVKDRPFTLTIGFNGLRDNIVASILPNTRYSLSTINVPTKIGEIFTGKWIGDDGEEYENEITVMRDITLTPQYVKKPSPVQYQITFRGKYGEDKEEIVSVKNDDDKKYDDVITFDDVDAIFQAMREEKGDEFKNYEIASIKFNNTDVTNVSVTLQDVIGGTRNVFIVVAEDKLKGTTGLDMRKETVDGKEVYVVHGLLPDKKASILFLPSEYEGKPVTGIAARAFMGMDITRISIPDTITEIGDSAFEGAVFHSDIELPALKKFGDSVFRRASVYGDKEITVTFKSAESGGFTVLKGQVFAGSQGISKVVLPQSVTEIEARSSDLAEDVDGEKENEIKEINLDNIKKIGAFAFRGSRLTDVGSLAEVTELGAYALVGALLTELNLPKIEVLGDYTFAGMKELNKLSIATESSKDAKIVFNWRSLKNCIVLTEVIFGDGIAEIRLSSDDQESEQTVIAYAESINVPKISSISISASTEKITFGDYQDAALFLGCFNLTEIKVAENNKSYASHQGVLYWFQEITEEVKTFLAKTDYEIGDKIAVMQFYPRSKAGDYEVPDRINDADVILVNGYLGYAEINTLKLNKNFVKAFVSTVDMYDEYYIANGFDLSGNEENFPTINNLIIDGTCLGEDKAEFVKNMSGIINGFTIVRNYYIENASSKLDFAAIFGEDWEGLRYQDEKKKVKKLEEGTEMSVYDSESGFTYSVDGDEITILLGNRGDEEITVPETLKGKKVTAIADDAFYAYANLKTVTIEATLKKLSGLAFAGSGVENISVKGFTKDAETQNFDSAAFKNTPYGRANNLVVLGERMIVYNDIGDPDNAIAYYDITAEMLDGFTAIPADFFKDKKTLKSVSLPNSVNTISASAFENCSVETVNFNNVARIRSYAFRGCNNLTEISLNSVTNMGEEVFANCVRLKKVNIPNPLNDDGKLPYGSFMGCTSLTDVAMPNIKGLAENEHRISEAFAGCSSLSNIDFVFKFDRIPGFAFRGTAVSLVDSSALPDNIQTMSIGVGAFAACNELYSVILTSKVSEIGSYAFYGCNNLKSVEIKGNGGILAKNSEVGKYIFPMEIKEDDIDSDAQDSNNTIGQISSDDYEYYIYVTLNADISKIQEYGVFDNETQLGRIKRIYPTVSFFMHPDYMAGENALNIGSINNTIYLATEPTVPSFDGYIFDGWYEETANGYGRIDFPYHVGKSVTLYAKFINVTKGTLTDDDVYYDEKAQEFWVISYTNSTDNKVYIPAMFDHPDYGVHPITVVYSGAFNNCNRLTSLVLPEGVKALRYGMPTGIENGVLLVDDGANKSFSNRLEFISIPASLEVMRGEVFVGLTNLTEISFAENSLFYAVEDMGEEAMAANVFVGSGWYEKLMNQASMDSSNSSGLIIAGRLAIKYDGIARNKVSVPDTVYRLGNYIFKGNEDIREIELNSELHYIGKECFADAINLEIISYKSGRQLDSQLVQIGENAFKNTLWWDNQDMVIVGTILTQFKDNTGNKTLNIPDYVTEIADGAFERSNQVEKIVFGSNSSLKKIGNKAFANTALTSITLPATVTEMGTGVFSDCSKLEFADLSLVKIEVLPMSTFHYEKENTTFKTLILNDSVKYFAEDCLINCHGLKEITANGIVSGIREDGTIDPNLFVGEDSYFDGAFVGKIGLMETAFYKSINKATEKAQYLILGKVMLKFKAGTDSGEDVADVPAGVETIAYHAFGESQVKTVNIPESVQFIAMHAFHRCAMLEEVNFAGDGVEVIDEYAFSECQKLANIALPSSLKSIGKWAFSSCTALKEIIIPDNVEEIGEFAFNQCSKLEKVTLSSKLSMIEPGAFSYANSLYKIEWMISPEGLDVLNANIVKYITENYLAAGAEFDFNEFGKYLKEVFGYAQGSEPRGLRIYFGDMTTYSYITNIADASLETEKYINTQRANQWADSSRFSVQIGGDNPTYPRVEFVGEGFIMEPIELEVINEGDIDTPARTGYTFCGWYTDEEYRVALELPYLVHKDLQLYPMWYKNFQTQAEAKEIFEINEKGLEITITDVIKPTEVIYVPAGIVVGMDENETVKPVVGFDMADTKVNGVKKLIFTNAGNLRELNKNIFLNFPDLEEMELLSDGRTAVALEIADNVVYTRDRSVIVAYLRKYVDAENDSAKRQLVTDFVVPDTVEEILPYAFTNSGLLTITIGSKVRSIGEKAFNDEMRIVTFPKDIYLTDVDYESFNNTDWYKMDSGSDDPWQIYRDEYNRPVGKFRNAGNVLLTYYQEAQVNDLVIPDSINGFNITVIAGHIFASRNGTDRYVFRDMVLPSGLIKINSGAFINFEVEREIRINGVNADADNAKETIVLTDIANDVFGETSYYKYPSKDMLILGKVLIKYVGSANNVIVPSYIKTIANRAFLGNTLNSVSLPEGLEMIGDSAFLNCENLSSVNIPASVVSIGDNAFAICRKLTQVEFIYTNSKLISIGDEAFQSDWNLKFIDLPHTVETIGHDAFQDCKNLTGVNFNWETTETDENGNIVTELHGLSQLKELGESAFSGCKSLVNVRIPDGLTAIKRKTFEGCSKLVNVVFDVSNSQVKVIESEAFSGCTVLGSVIDEKNPELVTVVTPSKLEVVESNAFKDCTGMLGIRFYYSLSRIESYAFSGCSSLAKIDIRRLTAVELQEDSLERGNNAKYKLRVYVTSSTEKDDNETVINLYRSKWREFGYDKILYERKEVPKIVFTRRGTDTTLQTSETINADIIEAKYNFGNSDNPVTSWKYDAAEGFGVIDESHESGYSYVTDTTKEPRIGMALGDRSDRYTIVQGGKMFIVVDYDFMKLEANLG